MESDKKRKLPHEQLCFNCVHNKGNGRCELYGPFVWIPIEQKYLDCKDAYDEKKSAMTALGFIDKGE